MWSLPLIASAYTSSLLIGKLVQLTRYKEQRCCQFPCYVCEDLHKGYYLCKAWTEKGETNQSKCEADSHWRKVQDVRPVPSTGYWSWCFGLGLLWFLHRNDFHPGKELFCHQHFCRRRLRTSWFRNKLDAHQYFNTICCRSCIACQGLKGGGGGGRGGP